MACRLSGRLGLASDHTNRNKISPCHLLFQKYKIMTGGLVCRASASCLGLPDLSSGMGRYRFGNCFIKWPCRLPGRIRLASFQSPVKYHHDIESLRPFPVVQLFRRLLDTSHSVDILTSIFNIQMSLLAVQSSCISKWSHQNCSLRCRVRRLVARHLLPLACAAPTRQTEQTGDQASIACALPHGLFNVGVSTHPIL